MGLKHRKRRADVDRAGGPPHFDLRRRVLVAEAEVHDGLVAPEKTIGETDLASLPPQLDDRSQAVTVARSSHQSKPNPPPGIALAAVQVGSPAEVRDHDVERSASVQIGDGDPASQPGRRILDGLRLMESARAVAEKELHGLAVRLTDLPVLLELRIDVAVRDEQVEDSVVADVEERRTPAEARERRQREAGGCGHVLEGEIAVVPEESVVVPLEIRDVEVEVAVGVVVGRRRAHARLLHAEGAVSRTGQKGNVLEAEASQVLEQELHARVVRDADLGEPIGVEVHEENAETAPLGPFCDRGAHVREMSPVLVAKERVARPGKAVRAAEDFDAEVAAPCAEVNAGEVDVGADVEIEEAVHVEIAEGGPGAPGVVLDSRFELGEGAVAAVSKQSVPAEASQVQVAVTVVIDVADGTAERPSAAVDSSALRDVLERESSLSPEEPAPGKEEIPDTVAVVIEDADPGSDHVRDGGLSPRTRNVHKRDEGRCESKRRLGCARDGDGDGEKAERVHPKTTVSGSA